MQRALRASETTGPHNTANKMSPLAVQQKITAPNQVETLKRLSKSDAPSKMETSVPDIRQKKGSPTPGSPQKTQSTKAAKGPERDTQASPTPGQKTPLDIQGTSASQKPTDQPSELGLKQSKVNPDSKQESGKIFGLSGPKTKPDASKTTESVTGKMFGFGSSIFSSASTLISAVQEESRTTPPGSRKMSAPAQASRKLSAVPNISPKTTPAASPQMSPAREPKTLEKKQEDFHQNKHDKAPLQPPKAATISKTSSNASQGTCPLCEVEFNTSSKDLSNCNTCTECKTTVCTQCGFNPMPTGKVSEVIRKQCIIYWHTVCTYTIISDLWYFLQLPH